MNIKHFDIYVVVQLIIMAVILLSVPYAHINLPTEVFVISLILIFAGAMIIGIAFKQLGTSLTPSVRPVQNGKLITTGIYSIVRHPMYSGVIMLALGWSLGWGSLLSFTFSIVLAVFFAFKAQKEEKLLNEKYPEYTDYKVHVKKKIIPYIY